MKKCLILLIFLLATQTGWAQQTITITSPAEGASISDPGSITINWTTSGISSGNVGIEYSMDGGTTWSFQFSRLYSLGTQNWTSPDLPTGLNGTVMLRIKLSADATVNDVNTFTISSSNPRTLSITSPTSGSTLTGAENSSIDFSFSNWVANDYVTVSFSLDGGTTYFAFPLQQLTTVSGTKSVAWQIYDRPTTQLYLKVQGYNDNSVFTTTTGPYTISSGTPWGFEFTNPIPGQTLLLNSEATVTWNNLNLSDAPSAVTSVVFAFSYDNGTNWDWVGGEPNSITVSGATGSQAWTPTQSSTACKVKLTTSDGVIVKESGVFKVAASIPNAVVISEPSGDEEVKFAATQEIKWLNTGTYTTNDIYQLLYSKDEAAYTNIGSFYGYQFTASGNYLTYNWTVPDFGADADSQVKIRVVNTTRSVSDTSTAFRVYYQPSVAITSPVVTDEVKFGTEKVITWTNGDRTTNDIYQLLYSKDNAAFTNIGSFYGYQFTASGNSLSYSWTVPDFGNDADSQVRIRVVNTTRSVSDTSASFRVYYQPSVGITSPISTDQVKFGTEKVITWTNGDRTTNDIYQLLYSKDNAAFTNIGSFYGYQFTASGNSLSYTWTVPDFGNDADSQVKIRVVNTTRSVSDTTDAFRVYYEPSVAITSPISTDQVKFGTQKVITWTNGDRTTNDIYQLLYSKDNAAFTNIGSFYGYQFTASGAQLSYTWTVPDFGNDADSQVKIRVVNTTRSVSDTTDAFRVYYQPSVVIRSPAAGENVLISSAKTITWENGDRTTNDIYTVQYSTNGTTFTNIGSYYGYQFTSYGDSLSLNWTVPNSATTSAKIRVINTTRSVSDTTLSFTICTACPVFTVVTPNGGESYSPGQVVAVTWMLGSSWDGTDQVEIMYSTDGGTTYTGSIYNSTYSGITSNSVNWTVPATEGTTYRVRVRNVTKSFSETSDANFTVSNTLKSPKRFHAKQNANGSVTFTWLDENATETGHRIEYSSNRTNWTSYSGDLAANVVTYTAPPLASGAAYWWRAVAIGTASTAASDIRHVGNISGAGSALKFDGTDDYVLLQDSTLFDFGTGNFTVETWFKTANGTNSQCLFNNYNGSISAYFVLFVQAGQMRAAIASNTYEIATPTLIENDKWYHAALVRSGDQAMIYVNGVLQATLSGLAARNASSTGSISLGRQGSTNSLYLNGEMDEARIWNTTRTASEISANFQTTLAGDETGLLAYYRFDHSATETLIADFAPNNFTGTWNGTGGVVTPQWVTSGALTITNPALAITAPNGGETYQIGETIPVTFTSTDISNSELIYLDYTSDGGETWTNIKNQARSVGTTITWPTAGQNLTAGTNYRVRVRNVGTTVSDASNASFTLTPTGILTVTSPNGGESWKGNTTQTISWTQENIADNHLIEIRLSTNGGETYPTIITDGTFGTYSTNSYQWVVPESVSSQARIQVVNTTLSVSDASNANFTIDEPVDVAPPQFANQPVINLEGDAFSASVTLTEYGNVYLVALEDGSSIPTAAQVKDAGNGTSTLQGQVAFGTALYTSVGQPLELTGTGTFVLNRLYDFYFTAEDTVGNLNAGYGVPNVLRSCTPLECDSLTLRTLYDEMGGENWTVGSDWLETTDITEWDGVTIGATNRVEGLSLPDNNLTGTLPTSILGLDALETLDLSGNELVGIPVMTSLETMTQFDISDNRLHFDDLQSNVTVEGIVYVPQKKLDEPVEVELVKGGSYQRTVQVGGSQNVYTWKLTNDSLKNVTVTSLTGNQLVIQQINYANQGKYTVEVTNTLVPGLTLESEIFEILATSDLIFTALGKNDLPLTEGKGYALKIIGKGIPFDSTKIDVTNNQLFFDNLVLGDYLIAAEADREVYLPTYYENTYLWEEADTLRLRGDQMGDLRMAFIPEPLDEGDGDNEIAGVVESDFEDEEGGRLAARRKVAQAGCSMRKFKGTGRVGQDEDDWELIAYVQTNEEGQFEFQFLPDGRYRFNIEYPGIPMDPNSFVEFEIGEGVEGSTLVLEAYITEDGIQVVKVDQLGFFKKVIADVSVYPNPAADYLQVNVENMVAESLTIRLLDIQGRELAKDQVSNAEEQLVFDIRTLPNGTYLLHFMDEANPTKAIIAYKVVVRH